MSSTVHLPNIAAYRQLKAQALFQALASQCRTPLDVVRFVVEQFNTTELRQLQQVAEAALRAGR